MNKNLLFTVILALLSFAVYQPVSAAASVELVPSSRVILKTTSDMTVDEIIKRVYPNDKDLWPQIKAKLIETNPNSFVQYSDRLIPGTRLKLVDIKRIYDQPEELSLKVRVGYVARLEGRVIARDVNNGVQQLQINSQVFEGDRIETEVGSRIQILMDDGAEVYLKEDSVLKISEYVITDGYGKESSSILDLLRGGLRKITGSIGASALSNYQIQTGLATIGIRGTDYVIKLCKQDDCTQTVSRNDLDAKLHAAVLDGAITLTTDEEVQILMATGEYGTATTETLIIEDEKPVPSGFLNQQETQVFSVATPVKAEAGPEEESSSAWPWVLGILLLAVGL
ncbi:MAG: FecR domain-containing protein [Gammaproteobacteria bacterium]|nr:MAG: FecR domain-containing protein [Gammaproteobacteria bacterium]